MPDASLQYQSSRLHDPWPSFLATCRAEPFTDEEVRHLLADLKKLADDAATR